MIDPEKQREYGFDFVAQAAEFRKAREAINVLEEAGALLQIVIRADSSDPITVSVRHSRDISSDTDNYEQRVDKPEAIEHVAGWMLPFEVKGTRAFAIIDGSDFSVSIHFIREDSNEYFINQFADKYAPGKNIVIRKDEATHLHLDGVYITYDDTKKRLLPSHPEDLAQIKEMMDIALHFAKAKVKASREAIATNSKSSRDQLGNFLSELNEN